MNLKTAVQPRMSVCPPSRLASGRRLCGAAALPKASGSRKFRSSPPSERAAALESRGPAAKSVLSQGVALVVTLLMLSVITVVAVAFLSLSRRGRANVSQTLNLSDTRGMNNTALERAIAQTIAPILATTNMLYGDMVVSRNFINTNGFQPGVSDYRNVSYVYANGQPLSPADFLQNLTNLLYDPRAPVFVRTNRPGTSPQVSEFRFYLDLNRNGQFETNGFFLPFNGNPAETNVMFFVGDPEWIGVLEKPNQPHAANNKFIGRYAYIILPVGKSLDLNFIHNQSQSRILFGQANRGRFYRDQGFATYEINLAAFLAALNTNTLWFTNYYYANNGICTGEAFLDALDLVQYRYLGNYNVNDSVQAIFGANAPRFTGDRIDGLARPVDFVPPTGFPDDILLHPWPGASSRQHFYSVHDYLVNRDPLHPYVNFINTLSNLCSKVNSYDRYSYYRLLSQLGTDTAEEPQHADVPALMRQISAQKPEEFLADTVGRINLNYDNINRVASDFVDWDPLTLFMNVGNVVLREQFIFGITNIPITPTNYYRPSVQRLLQVSANIYDASRTDLFPTVFLPTVGPIASPFNPSVPFSGISGYTLCPDRNAAIKWAATNDLGLPAIVGAKKGIPNFNEYVLQSAFQITRKLEMVRPTTNSLPNQTNQLMILAVSNVFGVETWNSYSRPISNYNFQVCVTNVLSLLLSNATDKSIYPPTGPMLFVSGNAASRAPTAGDNWYFKPTSPGKTLIEGGFLIPLYSNAMVLPASRYTGTTFDGLTNSYNRDGTIPVADWQLIISNRLTYIASAPIQGGTNRVLDLVCLAYQTNLNLTAFLQGQNQDEVDTTGGGVNLADLWNTNRVSYPATPSTPTEGVNKQLRISLGYEPMSDAFWKKYNLESNDKDSSIQSFKAFAGNTSASSNLFQQAPFTASRRFVHTVTWQANDPLVHYTMDDLRGVTNNASVRYLKPTDSDVFTNNLGRLNQRYQPWLGNPQKSADDTPDPNDTYLGVKDPGVFGSDDWDFPSQKFPNIGWLGRVHRGTPWQTIYLKAEAASPVRWQRQSLDPLTHPTNDWRLLDIFTVAQTPNSSHGQLSINQSGLAAWTAVLGDITVISNTVVNQPLMAQAPTNFTNLLIDPVAHMPVIQGLVDAINRARLQRPNQVFNSLGDLMSVPELTTGSPFINTVGNPASGLTPDIIQTYGFNDEAYERIPRQILSLLKVGDARFVVYAFGQSLKPADKSIVTSGNYFGVCTNYQITGEVYTRTLLKIDGTARNPRPVILNHNILPTE